MKKLLAIVAAFFSGSNASAMAVHEASMNFDQESVRPFLKELDSKFAFSLDIEKMVGFSESIEVEKEDLMYVQIDTVDGNSRLEFRVFMDDIDAPDLYFFFEQAELAQRVGEFMMEWAEERGM